MTRYHIFDFQNGVKVSGYEFSTRQEAEEFAALLRRDYQDEKRFFVGLS